MLHRYGSCVHVGDLHCVAGTRSTKVPKPLNDACVDVAAAEYVQGTI